MNRLDLIIDALENSEPTGTGWVHVHEQKHQAALAAARELIAQPEQKLIGWKDGEPQYVAQPEQEPKSISTNDHLCAMLRQVHDVLACTALPMKRPWVGLTDDEIHGIIDVCTPDEAAQDELNDFAKAIFAAQAKLKEKNNAV